MIKEFLPSPVARLSFALSGRIFFYSLGVEPLSREDRMELLLLLEKDDPMSIVCFGCYRLTKLDQGTEPAWCEKCSFKAAGECRIMERCIGRRSRRLTEHMRKTEKSWKPEKHGPEILFADAHLVMNRHLYGDSHGLPLEALERSYDFERFIPSYKSRVRTWDHFPLERHVSGDLRRLRYKPSQELADAMARSKSKRAIARAGAECDPRPIPRSMQLRPPGPLPDEAVPWRFSHRYEAKIIDGELYVRRSHHVVGPPGYKGSIGVAVANFRIPFCVHLVGNPLKRYSSFWRSYGQPLGFSDQGYVTSNDQIPGTTQVVERTYKQNGWCHTEESRLRACEVCYTDFDVSLRIRDDRFYMDVMTYHRLGTCRYPEDHVWTRLSNAKFWYTKEHNRQPSHARDETTWGQARAQWYKNGTVDNSAHWDIWDGQTYEDVFPFKHKDHVGVLSVTPPSSLSPESQ